MRTRALLLTSLFLFVTSLAGCAVAPTHLTKEEDAIRVFASAPSCKYKTIGAVGGTSGSTTWGTEGNYNATVSRMKKDAYKLGANAIIIKQENTSAGSMRGSVNEMLGDAILCEPGT
jgi:uncharacterized protein YbjQ (UPF0145 family)